METTNKNIEVARSFSRKVNLGNYETCDLFCSAKCECEEKDASQKSGELFNFCKGEVENSIKDLQIKNVIKNLEAKLKIAKDELAVARRTKNEREILDMKFKISLLKDEIKDCIILQKGGEFKMTNQKWEKVETAPTWNFLEETELIGFYVEAETDVGPNHSNLYTFRKEDNSMISVWGNTVLDNRFKPFFLMRHVIPYSFIMIMIIK